MTCMNLKVMILSGKSHKMKYNSFLYTKINTNCLILLTEDCKNGELWQEKAYQRFYLGWDKGKGLQRGRRKLLGMMSVFTVLI